MSKRGAGRSTTLQALKAAVLGNVPVTRQAFRNAAATAGRVDLGLRAGLALQLAVAADHGARVATRDVRQAEAGNRLGLDLFLSVVA